MILCGGAGVSPTNSSRDGCITINVNPNLFPVTQQSLPETIYGLAGRLVDVDDSAGRTSRSIRLRDGNKNRSSVG